MIVELLGPWSTSYIIDCWLHDDVFPSLFVLIDKIPSYQLIFTTFLVRVTFIQCRKEGSDDINEMKDTRVTCGWFTENEHDSWHSAVYNDYGGWWYGKNTGLQTVGTPHNCPGQNLCWHLLTVTWSSWSQKKWITQARFTRK